MKFEIAAKLTALRNNSPEGGLDLTALLCFFFFFFSLLDDDDDGLEQGRGRQPIKQRRCFQPSSSLGFVWRDDEGDETRQIENKVWSGQSRRDGDRNEHFLFLF